MNNKKNKLLEQALVYLKRGWPVFPVAKNKKPLVLWKKYQSVLPTEKEIVAWWEKYPEANIGVATGKQSKILVIDFDKLDSPELDLFKDIKTPISKTSRGRHYFFDYEDNIQNSTGVRPSIDVRGEGGFVILPPSIHKSGHIYEWILNPDSISLAPLPEFVKDWIKKDEKVEQKERKFDDGILSGVDEGSRNDAAASFIGKLLRELPEDDWEKLGWSISADWNQKNRPPLPEEELRNVWKSVKQREQGRREEEKDKSQSVALQLVKGIKKERILFFHNEQKEGFAAIKGDGREIYKLRSRVFRQFLAHYVYKQFGKIISADVVNNVIQILEGQAVFEGSCHELFARVARKDEGIWYDLGNKSVVYIDKTGWSVSSVPPIVFQRYRHQLSQVKPQSGGDLKTLCDFVNLRSDGERLLFLVFTVAAFIPDFPHPILVLFGPQGSGKTTPQRLLKSLIDPSFLKTLSAPDGEREFVQFASHHYFIFFDNLSALPTWLSDSLAKAVTGDGFSKRELFSDDDDILYSFQRVVALNGINLVVQRADLLERSILISLERISKDKRREEQEFWQEFEKQKPYLLGAIFDAVAGALREYPMIHLTSRPRMADFARWGCAIAKALGYAQKEFLEAYQENINQQNQAALEASTVATTIIALMADRGEWEGTASDLLTELEKVAEQIKINTRAKDWPKDPSWLSRRIQLVSTNLAEDGIKIERDEKSRPKKIHIQKVPKNADDADMPSDTRKPEAKSDATPSTPLSLDGDKNADKANGHSEQPLSTPTPPTTYSDEIEVDSREDGELNVDF